MHQTTCWFTRKNQWSVNVAKHDKWRVSSTFECHIHKKTPCIDRCFQQQNSPLKTIYCIISFFLYLIHFNVNNITSITYIWTGEILMPSKNSVYYNCLWGMLLLKHFSIRSILIIQSFKIWNVVYFYTCLSNKTSVYNIILFLDHSWNKAGLCN